MRLISTFAPDRDRDESGLGYYRRLAAGNAMWGWKDLARACSVAATKSGLLARPEHVVSSLGIAPEWAAYATGQDEKARSWRGLRRTVADAVCPQCLAESAHIRASWEHAYMVACPRHRILLCDHCGSCGQRLSANRRRIEVCDCGHDLRTNAVRPASSAQLWLAALISSEGASSSQWSPRVEGANLDLVSMLVRTLCLLSDPAAAPPRANSASPRTIAEAEEFLRPLDGLLADWPVGFEAHVRSRIAASPPGARSLNTALGKWYAELKALSACEPLHPFLEAVGRVAATDFPGVVGLDTAAEVTTKHATHVLVSQAAKRIGVHRDTLAKSVKAGEMAYERKKWGTRGEVYLVAISEVEAVIRERRGWVTEEAAGQMLGVPASVVQRMIDGSLLQFDPHWRRDLRKAGPLQLESVTRLATDLRKYASRARSAAGERIALCDLTSRRVGDKKALVRVLQAIASGEIRPVSTGELIGSFQYPLAEVSKHFSTPLVEAGLSVNGLAELTGWKWESISHWMELGLLESNSIRLRGQPCRVVMPAQVLAFCGTYIPLADLAKQLDSKSSAIAEKLQAVDVIGAKPLPNGQRRGGLVRIADLARLALSTAGLGAQEQSDRALCADITRVAQMEQSSCYAAEMQHLHPQCDAAGSDAAHPIGDKKP